MLALTGAMSPAPAGAQPAGRPVFVWGVHSKCKMNEGGAEAIGRRLAEMGERVLPLSLPSTAPRAGCMGRDCVPRLRGGGESPAAGKLIGAQIAEEEGGTSRVRVWLTDLATQQDLYSDFTCRDCDLNADLARHAANLIERAAQKTGPDEGNPCAAGGALAAAPPPVEAPVRDKILALSVYRAGGVKAQVSGVAAALKRALKDMGYRVNEIRTPVPPHDPRAALPPPMRSVPFLDVALMGSADGSRDLERVHIRLTQGREAQQTVVDCQATRCDEDKLPERVLANATLLLDASAPRTPPQLATFPRQDGGACAPWSVPACGVLIAQNDPNGTGAGTVPVPNPPAIESGAAGSPPAADASQPATGASGAAAKDPCELPPRSDDRKWPAGISLLAVGGGLLGASAVLTALDGQTGQDLDCRRGGRGEGCRTSYVALFAPGYAIAGISLAIGSGLMIAAVRDRNQLQKNRGPQCASAVR